jgi:hypothetical protein
MTENKKIVEMHGCLVCAKIFTILAIYTSDDKLVDCTVTSPGGQIVPYQMQPLVACNTHKKEEIEAAYQRWLGRSAKESQDEQENK